MKPSTPSSAVCMLFSLSNSYDTNTTLTGRPYPRRDRRHGSRVADTAACVASVIRDGIAPQEAGARARGRRHPQAARSTGLHPRFPAL